MTFHCEVNFRSLPYFSFFFVLRFLFQYFSWKCDIISLQPTNEHRTMTAFAVCYRQKITSMRLLNSDDTSLHLKAKEEKVFGKTGEITFKLEGGGGGDNINNTNVIWVQNPLTQLINTETCSDMPAATIGSSQHPSNEECGIRDVWAHNLEDEFRTIRQVNNTDIYTLHKVTQFNILDRPKVHICSNGH